jgi:putative endonuclease
MGGGRNTRKLGAMGEEVSARFLVSRGFIILERNYLRRCGEIDIIARDRQNTLCFIEVKSVSRENYTASVSHETHLHRPEDNVDRRKLSRIGRTIQSYLENRELPSETDWRLHLVIVYLYLRERRAKVTILKDIII